MSDILYQVNDLYTCVQGEGGQTGVAMVLLRLHGCAVGCPWCDTKETWVLEPQHQVDTLAAAQGANPRYVYLTAAAIAEHIQTNHPGPKWVLVTGGEPAQVGLRPLVTAIPAIGLKAAIETRGTEIGHVEAGFDWVCVSPKLNMSGGKVIQPAALAVADEIKHVVGRQQDIDELDELLTAVPLKPDAHICLQPVSVSAKATALCLEVVQQRGWRLS
ncbi:MAG TPA: 4Fe-4S cluster-binding domain-containing protein, partial [Chloroflexota bacterium]|nr:4Fe-4S cluster-binding domain-containing protein [Chloroflexota bacterium]